MQASFLLPIYVGSGEIALAAIHILDGACFQHNHRSQGVTRWHWLEAKSTASITVWKISTSRKFKFLIAKLLEVAQLASDFPMTFWQVLCFMRIDWVIQCSWEVLKNKFVHSWAEFVNTLLTQFRACKCNTLQSCVHNSESIEVSMLQDHDHSQVKLIDCTAQLHVLQLCKLDWDGLVLHT